MVRSEGFKRVYMIAGLIARPGSGPVRAVWATNRPQAGVPIVAVDRVAGAVAVYPRYPDRLRADDPGVSEAKRCLQVSRPSGPGPP